jgi:hypothetical protein
MTNQVVRLYTAAAALAVFFLAWAGIAARPWAGPPQDPRVTALAQREQRLQRDAQLVRQLVDRRRAADRAAGAATPAAAPSVRVVTLPPVATTRSS